MPACRRFSPIARSGRQSQWRFACIRYAATPDFLCGHRKLPLFHPLAPSAEELRCFQNYRSSGTNYDLNRDLGELNQLEQDTLIGEIANGQSQRDDSSRLIEFEPDSRHTAAA